MRKPDVVVVLGGGLGKTLEPIAFTKERVDFLLSQQHLKTTPIIVSGGYSLWLKKAPRHTEAKVMKSYLVRHGVPKDLVLMEDKSQDTIGNVYFAKQIIKQNPSWKKILVITTKEHVDRSRWLFARFFGRSYTIQFLWASTSLVQKDRGRQRKKYEQFIVDITKQNLHGCKDGDDACLMRLLKRFHPVYSSSARSKRILEQIRNKKKELLGI
jgi:uncharacterized SAM-binding protein YcdF (DUF218 family)